MSNRRLRWLALLAAVILIALSLVSTASPPIFTDDVTDFGRTPWRTHYTPTEPEYPRARDARPAWEVPLGLSRSQPLVVKRQVTRDGPEVTIYHIAGDRLWALNGDMTPRARQPGESVEAYRAHLAATGFIRWSTPAESLCTSSGLTDGDPLLEMKCLRLEPRKEQRPFASSHVTYMKANRPANDILYVGFGHPASVVAIRAADGQMLGGYIVDAVGDRGIVGAPLLFPDDTVVIGTTSGEAYIIKGLATGRASVRGLRIGGRISFSPVPVGTSAFLMAADARHDQQHGTHGYMMAYSLASPGIREFQPRWPAAVVTPAGIPGEAAIDAGSVYFADKFGRLYALRLDNGELLWCRQYPTMGACTAGGDSQPGFINNGPGVDEDRVYFVFRNSEGPNRGNGHVVAIHKATGELVWRQPMSFRGNTAPVPMGNIVIVGDTGGYVRAFDKRTGAPVTQGGYPLQLSDEPYKEGSQGEKWWEPIGGTATQMTVAAGMMLVGVNSETEERTVLRAFRLYRMPDLVLELLDTPPYATGSGFTARVRAACKDCGAPVTTTVSLRVSGAELPRQLVTFRPENNWAVTLTWHSGPVRPGSAVQVLATVDPENLVDEADETNNSLRATVWITAPAGPLDDDGWGSRLTN